MVKKLICDGTATGMLIKMIQKSWNVSESQAYRYHTGALKQLQLASNTSSEDLYSLWIAQAQHQYIRANAKEDTNGALKALEMVARLEERRQKQRGASHAASATPSGNNDASDVLDAVRRFRSEKQAQQSSDRP
jgi:hypothetical protein